MVETLCMIHINHNALYGQKVLSSHMSNSSQECHLFSIKLVLFQSGCHDNHENYVIAFPVCLTV